MYAIKFKIYVMLYIFLLFYLNQYFHFAFILHFQPGIPPPSDGIKGFG